MKQIESKDSDLWNHFKKGNRVVNKTRIPFCALGSDVALKHENEQTKILGGLVNREQKKQAVTGFFFTFPELSKLFSKVKKMVGIKDY